MDENKRPKVGLGVCIVKDGKVLIGQRLSPHGNGTWSFPGGHLEYGESFADCAFREVAEEVGVKISEPVFVTCTNDVFVETHIHYITVYVKADWISGEPQILEPDKMVKWQWFDWGDLPQPLFLAFQHLVESGFRP